MIAAAMVLKNILMFLPNVISKLKHGKEENNI